MFFGYKINEDLKFNNKCEQIAKVSEFMSKNSQFEKCFTYFNINNKYNNSLDYKMDKSSRIEFYFLSKLFENNLTKFDKLTKSRSIKNLLYISLHSSQSVFETRDFQPIFISHTNQSVFNFKFSKTIIYL